MKSKLANLASNIIGDGKIPNKYIVCQSNDVYECVDNCLEWKENKNPESETVGIYDTYIEALEAIEDECYMSNRTIEDRLSGELFSSYEIVCPTCGNTKYETREDIGFTEQKLGCSIKGGE